MKLIYTGDFERLKNDIKDLIRAGLVKKEEE